MGATVVPPLGACSRASVRASMSLSLHLDSRQALVNGGDVSSPFLVRRRPPRALGYDAFAAQPGNGIYRWLFMPRRAPCVGWWGRWDSNPHFLAESGF